MWLATLVVLAPALGGADEPLMEPAPGQGEPVPEFEEVRVDTQREPRVGSAASGYRFVATGVGPLGTMPLQDTPFSLHVTSGALFENRGAHTVSEALKTNPSVVTLMESNGYSSLSRVMIRGFTAADQSDLRDGLVDRSFTFVPLENVDRIEVLNGLSGLLYGFSSLGGSINYVSKAPTTERFLSVTLGEHGGGLFSLHGDSGGPIDEAGRWGYRVNVYGEDGSTYIQNSHQRRDLVSGVLQFKPLPNLVLHADIWHQDLDMRGLQTYLNVNPAGGIPVPSAAGFRATTQYGQDWTYNTSEKNLFGGGVEATLFDFVTIRAAYRRGTMWRDYLFVGATLTDREGSYSEKATGSTRQAETTNSLYALVDLDLHTWSVTHKITVGYTHTDYLYTRGDDVTTSLGTATVATPQLFANLQFAIGPTNVWYQQFYRTVLLADRLDFSPTWAALVGVTWANLQQKRWGSGATLATPEYNQHRFTPSASVMFKPVQAVTTYASYVEGLANGGTAPSTAANAYQVLAPSVSNQAEVGAKATLGRLELTGAFFYINKVNEYLDPTDNVYKQDGRQAHLGVELSATGKLVSALTLVGGVTFLDARITKASNNPSLEGKSPVNVPRVQARLYLEYAFGSILTATAGGSYSDRRPVDAANTSYLDGAATFDVGLRHEATLAGQKLALNLTVSNLFNTPYWTYFRSGDGLSLGPPRLLSFTAKTEW